MIKRIIVLLVALLLVSLTQSCERLKQKTERRNRRIEYLQKNIDSARKLQSKSYDTIKTNN